MAITAYIGFGSNLGDLYKNFIVAREKIAAHDEIEITRVSDLYKSEPMTINDEKQSWYLNGVFEIQTTLSLHRLLYFLKAIEKQMGRNKAKKWASRIMDLDILFFGDVMYKDNEIKIPHEGIQDRRFVLKPLCDLIPNFHHPSFEIPIMELLENTTDTLALKAYSDVEGTH